jgi:hypothetical protein
MSTQVLRDSLLRIIGYVETRNNGDLVLRDSYQRILGYYDARFNLTRDSYMRTVGSGNILLTLLC